MVTEVISAEGVRPSEKLAWRKVIEKYREPSAARAGWQIANTFIPYVGLWVAMYWTLGAAFWLTFPLAVLAGLLLVRIFIIFHDCGHGSYFKTHYKTQCATCETGTTYRQSTRSARARSS